MRSLSSLIMAIFIIGLSSFNFAHAEQVKTEKTQSIHVSAWLGKKDQPQDVYAVSQQIILYIDVSTPTWFLGPTKIGNIDVSNLIVKQRNPLATNYTERKDGTTWSHQRWEFTLYPQSSGQYTLPEIPISATIANQDAKKVIERTSVPAMSFQVALPDAKLTDKQQWFAASKVNVTQEWQTSNSDLHVGDAVTRIIKIEAQDSLSILLPHVLTSPASSLYQAYPDPAVLEDKSVRGDYQSSREDKSVYLLQQGGELDFPSYQVTWWNPQSQTIETMTLEGKHFEVKHTFQSFVKAYWVWIVSILAVLIFIGLVILAIVKYYQSHPAPLLIQFRQAIRSKDMKQARLILYLQLKKLTGKNAFVETEFHHELAEELAQAKNEKSLKGLWYYIMSEKPKQLSKRKPLNLERELQKVKSKEV